MHHFTKELLQKWQMQIGIWNMRGKSEAEWTCQFSRENLQWLLLNQSTTHSIATILHQLQNNLMVFPAWLDIKAKVQTLTQDTIQSSATCGNKEFFCSKIQSSPSPPFLNHSRESEKCSFAVMTEFVNGATYGGPVATLLHWVYPHTGKKRRVQRRGCNGAAWTLFHTRREKSPTEFLSFGPIWCCPPAKKLATPNREYSRTHMHSDDSTYNIAG